MPYSGCYSFFSSSLPNDQLLSKALISSSSFLWIAAASESPCSAGPDDAAPVLGEVDGPDSAD